MLKKILALFMFFSFLTGGYSMAADNLNAKEKSIKKDI